MLSSQWMKWQCSGTISQVSVETGGTAPVVLVAVNRLGPPGKGRVMVCLNQAKTFPRP